MSDYYALLSALINLVSGPLRDLDTRIGIPAVTALILGLIGSTSPCQLTTNVAALAFVSRDAASPRHVVGSAVSYLLGKIAVYTVIGISIAIVGLELSRIAVPVAMAVRKATGPLLILGGLVMLGTLRLNLSFGQGLSARLENHARSGVPLGSFLIGAAFSFAFCPTLFWLFFGILIPLSLSSPGGITYPAVFALGTTIPLLAATGMLALGITNLSGYLGQVRRFDVYLRRTSGAVFVAAGINEIIVYWFS